MARLIVDDYVIEKILEASFPSTDRTGRIDVSKVIEIIKNAPTVVVIEECISREDALDVLCHGDYYGNACIGALQNLPSVPFVEVQQGEPITTLYTAVKKLVDALKLTKTEKDLLQEFFTSVYRRQVWKEENK